MMKIHPTRNAVELYHPEKGNFGSLHVWDIKEDSIGNLWIATLRDGLCYFNPTTKKYHYYKASPGDSSALANDDIMALCLDSKGYLWIGTSNGLSVLLPGKKTFKNFYSNDTITSLSNNIIYCMQEDQLGRVWIGTNGGGITIMDKNLSIVKILKEKQGLPNNTIRSLQVDKHGNIWAGTNKGLAKINIQSLKIEDQPQVGGLREKEFGINASLLAADGRLLFGGSNGFDMFDPDSLPYNPHHTNIVFTSLKIFNDEITADTTYHGRTIISKTISEASEINLSHEDYSFTLTFAPLTFNWQKNLRYSYFMKNLDHEWQFTTSDRRFVHYSNLTPGEYIFHVKASFDGSDWPEYSKTIRIIIHPPWWGTWWFRGSALLIIISFLFSLYTVRVKFLSGQKRKLEWLVETRTTELKKSNEELRSKNSKIEMQNEEIQTLLEELAEQKHDIEDKNLELNQINEELASQRDTLELKSIDLVKAQERLQNINTNLEQVIEKRTEKLNEAVRELETFLYRASHDLRGPITSMLGLIRVAELDPDNSDKVFLEFLRKPINQLERTLFKLVQIHTIHKSQLTKEVITKPVLLQMLNLISRGILHFRFHDFVLKIQDDIMFRTDKAMLELLLTNLLENAFIYSERSTNEQVSLDIHQNNDTVVISVMDYGSGIKPDVKDKLFTMFFRGDERSTGNGLGLYLVKSALIKIGGTITLETELGSFTKFVATIPTT
jgi:signal transduction histidine kinase